MTHAYAEIANGGHAIWPYAVLSVEDSKGNIIFQRENNGGMRLFSPRDISQLDDMLVQVVAQGTGQAAQLTRGHVAGKTGTTQDYRDAWFIGYTNKLVTGVWMGNDDNSPMNGVTGGKYPARLWHDYMEPALGAPVENFAPAMPRGDTQDSDGFSGMLERLSNGWSDESEKQPDPKVRWRDKFNGNDKPVYNP